MFITTTHRFYLLTLSCVVFGPALTVSLKNWYYVNIFITNYDLFDPCFCMAFTEIPDSFTCVPYQFIQRICNGQSLKEIFAVLPEALNQSATEATVIQDLKITLDKGEFVNTVVFDQKDVPSNFQFERVTVTHRTYSEEDSGKCPSKGNGETYGALSFIDWASKTSIESRRYYGCKNDKESIITIRNSSHVYIHGIDFYDNEQSPIFIIDSNVNISNCTIENTRQYYNYTLKENALSGLGGNEIAFSLGITIMMTSNSTKGHYVKIDNVTFKHNRCMKKNKTEQICVHNVDQNAIPTSFFGGAIGAAFTSTSGSILIINSVFINNTACDSGGGVFIHVCDGMNDGRVVMSNCTFRNNTAGYLGGGLYLMQEIEAHNFFLEMYNSVIEENQGCIAGGGIAVLVADKSHRFNLIDNLTNLATERVSFSYFRNTKFIRNYSGRISSGHAAYLKAYDSPAKKQHPVIVFRDCDLSYNHKLNNTPNGLTFGSILAENFIIVFAGNNNISNCEAGGLLLIQSITIIYGNVSFNNLSAYSGGAIHARKWSKVLLTEHANVVFNNNSASIAGGAIFHYFGNWNGYAASSIYNSYCLLGYFPSIRTPPQDWKSYMTFISNDATTGGGAVFVTDLRQCALFEGKMQLDKAFNYTDKFVYINNTVAQGKLTYLGDSYGTIAGSVEKLASLLDSNSYEKGPGIEIPINYVPLDQLGQVTIAVIKFKPSSPSVMLDDDYHVVTPKDINVYMKCKVTNDSDCLLNSMPYLKYRVNGHIPETVTFEYTIKSGIESVNTYDEYDQQNPLIINNPYCDVGYVLSQQGICSCDYDKQQNGIIKCTSTGSVYIHPGYWGIKRQEKNSNFTLSSVIVKCAHSTCACNANAHSFHGSNCIIPEDPNDLCVEELNREGDLCGNCKENYTFLPFAVECVPAPNENYHILMVTYVLMTFVSACLILIFRCKFWNGFRIFILVLYSLTYINYSFNLIHHISLLRMIQILQGFTILNFYIIYPAYKDIGFTTTEILALYPVVTILIVLAIFAGLSAISYKFPASSFHHKFKIRRLISPAIYLWYIMSISLFRIFLDFSYCIRILNNGTEVGNLEFRNRYSGTTECYTMTNGYVYYMIGVFFLALILVIPVPVLLIIGSLKCSIERSYTLNKLILPFRPWGRFHWGWEYIRFLILAIGLVTHDTVPKFGNSMLSMFIVFLMIIHICVWPYKEKSANIIECIGWILLSLLFIIDNAVTLDYSYMDVFQLILLSLIIILLGIAFVTYTILKIASKLAKDKFRARIKKVFPKKMPVVGKISSKLYKQLRKSVDDETFDELRVAEKAKVKQKVPESLHRRDSILTKLSLAVNTSI